MCTYLFISIYPLAFVCIHICLCVHENIYLSCHKFSSVNNVVYWQEGLTNVDSFITTNNEIFSLVWMALMNALDFIQIILNASYYTYEYICVYIIYHYWEVEHISSKLLVALQ